MPLPTETSDAAILDLLRQRGARSIAELAEATHVTATAVRQRLARLMEQELVDRQAAPAGRGRPSHRYRLTDKGQRQTGNNFSDLALVLWQEVRAIRDPEIRRGLLQRIARQMAALYAPRVEGQTLRERMQSVAKAFTERNVPFTAEAGVAPAGAARNTEAAGTGVTDPGYSGEPSDSSEPRHSIEPSHSGLGSAAEALPVLTAWACPYPELAEQDRGICALERMMFAELLERDVKLSACRLDGESCCRFEPVPTAAELAVASH